MPFEAVCLQATSHLHKMRKAGPVLYLSKVPANQNSVHALLAHYKKYGHIMSIWAEGTNAVVRFEKEESAVAAYHDPVPFLMNRFIRVYFHKVPEEEESNLERLIDQDIVSEKAALVSQAIEKKISEQEEIRKQMAEENMRKQQLEELKKQRSDFIVATAKLIGETTEKMESMNEEEISKMKELIKDAQALLGRLDERV